MKRFTIWAVSLMMVLSLIPCISFAVDSDNNNQELNQEVAESEISESANDDEMRPAEEEVSTEDNVATEEDNNNVDEQPVLLGAESATTKMPQNPRVTNGVSTWDCVYFGNYCQRTIEPEPIKWRVLNVNGNEAFLLADKNLDGDQPYSRILIDKSITWENCSMRSYLNNNFFLQAFTSEERDAIISKTIKNDDNHGIDGGNDTTDKIFLLSVDEVTNENYGFISYFSRIAFNTAHTAEDSIYTGVEGGPNAWWLRSPAKGPYGGYDYCCAAEVGSLGAVISPGEAVEVSAMGNATRPALYLDLSSSTWSNAGTVSSDEIVDDPDREYPIEKKTAKLSFAYTNVSKNTTDDPFKNELTKETDGEITYSSSNTGVAAVDSSGLVTIKGAGTTTITAISSMTSTYKRGEAEYTLTVEPDNPEPDPEPVEKKTANLTFAYSNISKYTTDGSFKNELTKETDGEITYSSSNTGVAAVDSSGLVTIKGAGTTTITAKSSETSTYKSGEAEYTLTVEKKSGIAVSDVSYGFENFSKRVPISICKYMYGNTQTANDVYYMNIGDGGNCYGMAASSSILYVPNDLNVKSFDQSKSKISQLSKTNKNSSLGLSVENFIQAMHITQVSIYMKETRVRTGTLDKFVNVVKEQTNNGKPILLSIFGRTSQGAAGHAITVTGIKKETNTSVSLAVYDNNYPNEERTIIINKDSSGNCKSWEYELWSGLVWGTGKSGNDMWYSTYEDYYRVWNMRGKLANAERNLLVADTQDFEVVDDNSNSIAKVENGVLASENEDVVNLTPIGISPSNPQGSEYFVLSLPIDNYEIINNDATKDTLTVSISNKKLGTTVCTESDQVLLYAEDSENATGAAVKADVDEAYSIEVKTSTLGEVSSVKYDGVGNGLKVAINYSNGVIDTNNTSNATVSKGDKNSISINAGEISVKPSGVSYTYNGKAITPAVTVKDYEDVLKKDKNYKVSYSSNKNVGTGKITVTGINGLTDKKSLSFTINPKGTNLSKVSKGKKSFTVKWKKQSAKMSSSRITGYQVRYSTSSSMASAKVVTVKGYSKTSKKISRLKAKKKYYVQVRTYKTVSGKKYYSGWSSKKSVVTK